MSAIQGKKFTQRNVFYLRASPYVVLQTILYLDYRHVEWMNLNPAILTQVLSILRTRIMPKLRKESDSSGKLSAMSKKERVDVYSDRDFQVAYFFRRMDDRHSVLLKEKSLIFPSDPTLGEVKVEEEGDGNLHAPIPRATPAPERAASVAAGTGVRDGESSDQPMRIKDSPEAQEMAASSSNASMATLSGAEDSALFRGGAAEDDALSMPPPASTSTRRSRAGSSTASEGSRRSKRVRIQDDVDVKPDPAAALAIDDATADATALLHEGVDAADDAPIIITEEDEEKMKPKLHVKYAGFRIFGKLLVLVVEPSKRTLAAHPELFGEKKTTEIRQLSVAPRSMTPGIANNRSGSVQGRFTSLEPAERSSRNASIGRGSTPLFRGATPAESEVGGSPSPMRGSATPAPRGTSVLSTDAVGTVEDQSGETEDDGPTIGELEGIELATQMLAREEQTMGGNDIEEGD
ncbi:hypothetical protein PSEUBRA_002616 [Kalmanozyma brasiliensis GHG001]|uniref:Uncharacterized protein n=1 Tax=Kalmanozyma brasiliensis (strain GHG001) TaxID=1365824 RepID=V5EQZ3_KALBG|nr:uncharacterized protein PSEUBRA_002616 [Kalmanozyma brasiliensis GHG001]EST07535.1 hypothetical protein PSEUBRA_002616 [Kalmanozyma brasiliensis GHG001]